MTDDDSDFSPLELKIEFILRKFIQFTLIELLFSFIFLDLWGGLYDEHTVNQQIPFQNWGGGLIRGGLFAGIYGKYSIFPCPKKLRLLLLNC